MTPDLSTWVETNYLLKTDDADPAYITVKTNGWRTGDRHVLEKLFDPEAANNVSPADYKFRLYVKMETGDERYSFVNTAMWVASGARYGLEGKLLAFCFARGTVTLTRHSHIRQLSYWMKAPKAALNALLLFFRSRPRDPEPFHSSAALDYLYATICASPPTAHLGFRPTAWD